MYCSKLTPVILLVWLCLSGTGVSPAWSGENNDAISAKLSESHQRFLVRVVRRTVRDRILNREPYVPAYIPDGLRKVNVEVIVRLRERGYLRAAAAAGPMPIVQSTLDAAKRAADSLVLEQQADVDVVDRLLVEIEMIGAAEPFAIDGDWTLPGALDPWIEPGIHGLVLTGPNIQQRFTPTELFTSDLVLEEALDRVVKLSHARPVDLRDVKLMRFQTQHWIQYTKRDNPVSLQRGLVVIPPQAVTSERIEEAIASIADYMIYRQLDSGLFTYQYEPALDRYSDEQNLTRQVGAVGALALHASYSKKAASYAATDLGISFHRRGVSPIPGHDDAAFLATADGRNKLGVTALYCLALAYHPDAARYADLRERLVAGMLTLQRPSGMFVTAFPPAHSIQAQEYFPGEALLAMAHQYTLKPSGTILDAFHQALEFYSEYFRRQSSPAFAPWQIQAYALMAKHSKRSDYSGFVFDLADFLIERQLTPANCRWPEMWGGIAAYTEGRAGVSTAAYLEGLADALDLAQWANETQHLKRYEAAVRLATRFVLQLQIRPEEAYFIRSPQDAVGGIRSTPTLNLLRIDHCQHALVGLIKARRVLFPNPDD